MSGLKFDPAKIAKLDDPARLDSMRPEVMWSALGSPCPAVIVDIGAGTGLFAERFAELAPGATVYAVDTEPAMIEWMGSRARSSGGRIVPLLAQETRVPLDDGAAQLVTMLNLHHELDDPPASYGESLRLLEPGGQLLVVDWAPHETPKGPPVAARSSAQDVEAMLRAVGFVDVSVHEGALAWHWLVTAVRP